MISLEMVKYYLCKTRKILKEGIITEREFGEKSFRPAEFKFACTYDSMHNVQYVALFDRKLPGNILLAAYYTPMSVRELSVELGVASAYLEGEIRLLEEYGMTAHLPPGKYQTRLGIYTREFFDELKSGERDFCKSLSPRFFDIDSVRLKVSLVEFVAETV